MSRHLVVMAAGTGGHVIPGLAVAREMLARGWTVSWLGTTHGMENKLVPPSGIAMDNIAFSGVRGKGLLHTLSGGVRLLGAFWSCLRILRARRADAVLGMGGYVCFPGGLMAALLGKPLLLVNADAALLLSNKALLPVAERIAFGFDGPALAKLKNAVVTGNPVRAEIAALPEPAGSVRRCRCWLRSMSGTSRHTHMPPVSTPRCGRRRSRGSISSVAVSDSWCIRSAHVRASSPGGGVMISSAATCIGLDTSSPVSINASIGSSVSIAIPLSTSGLGFSQA